MTLTDEQKAKVAEWIEAGASLNDIQERLRSELEITITFLETRFLLADLDLEIKEPEEPEKPAEEEPVVEGEVVPDEAPAGGGAVTVGVDQIARPGAAVSGKVTFSDGKRAAWYVTQHGELGLDPEEEGYRPSEGDVMTFQKNLQELLRKEGF